MPFPSLRECDLDPSPRPRKASAVVSYCPRSGWLRASWAQKMSDAQPRTAQLPKKGRDTPAARGKQDAEGSVPLRAGRGNDNTLCYSLALSGPLSFH